MHSLWEKVYERLWWACHSTNKIISPDHTQKILYIRTCTIYRSNMADSWKNIFTVHHNDFLGEQTISHVVLNPNS